MNGGKWVQHISGQGEKWEVLKDYDKLQPNGFRAKPECEWYVRAQAENPSGEAFHVLPKSEYRLCEPPERWEDVTEQCQSSDRLVHCGGKPVVYMYPTDIYRFRKVQIEREYPKDTQWAFIVEKKVQP